MMLIVGEQKPPIEELFHYGVKGMKWGVVREKLRDRHTAPTTMSKADRKQARKNITQLGWESAEKKYGADNPLGLDRNRISEAQYNKYSTKDEIVRKGSELGRITKRKDEKYDDITYVAYKKADRDLYKAIMPLMGSPFKFGGNKRYKNTYEVVFKATENLKSPSEKARVDAFIDIIDSPSIKLRNGKMITGREHLKRMGYRKEVKTLDSTRLGLEFYKQMVEYQYTNNRLNTAYFEHLRKKGYNSVLDDNDRGHLSEAPLILLNPNGSVKQMNVRKLTSDEINQAQLNLKLDNK